MSTMTVDELRQLKDKAISYCKYGGSTECKWLYRNKSMTYFEDMITKDKGLMKGYIKDKSGDPRSPINDRLNGLFFMARHENGKPPSNSAFGPIRLQVPADMLMSRTPNVYFTDFYCMQSNWHYVTLVAASNYSLANNFCRRNILPVSLYDEADNPFLFYRNGQLYVSSRSDFHVELFYTDDIQVFRSDAVEPEAAGRTINIFDSSLLALPGAEMKLVSTFGRGSSTPGGLRKNLSCHSCNLNPVRRDPFNFDAFSFLLR